MWKRLVALVCWAWLLNSVQASHLAIPLTIALSNRPTISINDPMRSLVMITAKVELDSMAPFYGTAIAIGYDADRIYYITNAHIIPKNFSLQRKINLYSAINFWNPTKAFVVGLHRGYDIGVLSVDRSQLSRTNLENIERSVQLNLQRNLPLPSKQNIAVLGVALYHNDVRPQFKNWTWEEESPYVSGEKLFNYDERNPFESYRPTGHPVTLESRRECPPPLLNHCFLVPLRSWGYSGGALLAAPENSRDPKDYRIVGIISHYSPLTELTWVIPLSEALAVGEEIIEEFGRRRSVVELTKSRPVKGQAPLFEMKTGNRVQILGGTLQTATMVAERASNSSEGGGEQAPAGIESSAGGSDSSPGGIESSAGGIESSAGSGATPGDSRERQVLYQVSSSLFMMDRANHIAGFANYDDLVKETLHPENWNQSNDTLRNLLALSPLFRGTDAIFSFRPGARIDGSERFLMTWGDIPILSFSHFFKLYEQNPSGRGSSSFTPTAIPPFMKIPEKTAGIATFNEIFRLKSTEELLRENQYNAAYALLSLPIHEASLLLAHARYKHTWNGKKVDVVTLRNQPYYGTSIKEAFWSKNEKNHWVLDGFSYCCGRSTIEFLDEFVPLSPNYFRYMGRVAATTVPDYGIREPQIVSARGSLQYDPILNRYELKIVTAGSTPDELLDKNSKAFIPEFSTRFLDPDKSVTLTSFYVPLEPDTKKREPNFTLKDERRLLERYRTMITTAETFRKLNPDGPPVTLAPIRPTYEQINLVLDHLETNVRRAVISPEEKAVMEKIRLSDKRMREVESLLGIDYPPMLHLGPEMQAIELDWRLKIVEWIVEHREQLKKHYESLKPPMPEAKQVEEIIRRAQEAVYPTK